ncbi:MAG: SWIM zinc finger family protein [Noviherbaspirillum sp.]
MGRLYEEYWPPYVPVAQRREQARAALESLKRKGVDCQPVAVGGRMIASTFWGSKWCGNLEAYSDFENRLPRGRSCVRHGAVLDLKIAAGTVDALVSGTSVYKVRIGIRALPEQAWKAILDECAGKVATLVELLQGRLSAAVMDVVTRPGTGLFPTPKQIDFRCSCPDSASMCKHVAAALYAVGNRLDSQPELLFLLRHVDPQDLIRQAANAPAADATAASAELDSADLSALFGIELDAPPAPVAKARKKQGGRLG